MAIEGFFYMTIKVADLARAKRFYSETLGWELQTDEPMVAGLACGTGYVVAHLDADGAKRISQSMQMTLKVTDLKAEHARLTQKGVAPSSIVEHRWGEVSFAFADPDGYVWKYAQ